MVRGMWSKLFGIGDLDGAKFTQLVAKIGVKTGRLEEPTVDPENMRVYAADWKAKLVVCLDFDPQQGFRERWIRQQKMFCFPSLCGDAGNRQLVGMDYDSSYGDQVVWRDAATGEEVARSAYLDPNFNGSTVGPGSNGRFYYLAQTYKAIVELTPVPAPQG